MKNSRLQITALFLLIGTVSFLNSCTEESTDVKEVIVEKTVVETVVESVDSAAILESDPNVAILQEEVLGLNKKNQSEKQTIASLNSDVKKLNIENDSLRTSIHQKDNVIQNLAAPNQKKITTEELQIRALIQNLNNAWINLPASKNNDEFLTLFLPEFAVSMVSIGLDDEANVKMLYNEEFSQFLNDLRKKEGFTIQVGNVDYVFFDGRRDVYSIVYTAILRSYQNEVPVMDRSFSATVTVKRVDGNWKIGKYSWASMGHQL